MSDEAPAPAGSSSSEQWHPNHSSARKARLPRACHNRSTARFQQPASQERRPSARRDKEDQTPASRIITPLLAPPSPSQLPRWSLRSMWELASLVNFLHVFRPLLNIVAEFSAEELETALITPNSTLDDIHIPLLKAIPPVIRMALGRATWVTVLCRKLRDWWHWVADGEIPIVASHGAEIEAYKALEPGTRVLILKALCDIRVEQEDIRSYIDGSLKHGIQLSAFRRERIGGDSHGISYWYEDDPVTGHRLYREIRQIEVKEGKKAKTKGSQCIPLVSYQWETVATNFDEFQEVSDKLFSSKNRIEAALGKRLKVDILPDVEKAQRSKERLLKKQHRQALLLDTFMPADALSSGRALRDRKPVTYTFDDYDRSINEALKITKKRQASPEQVVRKEVLSKPEACGNGKWNGIPQNGKPQAPQQASYDAESPKSNDYEETDGGGQPEPLDRSNRRRKKPERYSEEFVKAVLDDDGDFDSDDDIVGEAVYDEEYLRNRKQQKLSSSSEGDEEYRWEDNVEDEEEAENSLSISEDSEERPRYKKLPTRSRLGTKLCSVDDIQSGLRRSKRSTRPRINYRQYEMSDTEGDSGNTDKSTRPRINYRQYEMSDTDGGSGNTDKSRTSEAISDASKDEEVIMVSQDSQDEVEVEETKGPKMHQDRIETVDKEPCQLVGRANGPSPEIEGVQGRRFLDLNELAPGIGFEDGPSNGNDEDHL